MVMSRVHRLCRLSTWVGALVLAVSGGRWVQPLIAQQHPSTTRAGLEAIQIRPNVHVIFGAGGNVTVHAGEDGLVVVDSGSGEMADRLLEAIRAISPQPIRVIINTGADLDHVGGNAVIGGAGVGLTPDPFGTGSHATVLAHENVLLRLSAATGSGGESLFPTRMLPNDTFTSRFRSMYVNDEAVQVIRQMGAHSDSDVMVLFRKADVIATGDVIDLRQFPVIDPAKGGSIQGELEALNRLLTELVVPNTPLAARWRLVGADDPADIDVGPEIRVTVTDDRFEWRTVAGDLVRVHWYEGGDAFGRQPLGHARAHALGELDGSIEFQHGRFRFPLPDCKLRTGPGKKNHAAWLDPAGGGGAVVL